MGREVRSFRRLTSSGGGVEEADIAKGNGGGRCEKEYAGKWMKKLYIAALLRLLLYDCYMMRRG